jgi:anti-sigma28 factor (negative regulator of flagellin synthesis)
VELSGAGAWLDALKANDVRTDKVTQIKSQIEAGTYEDDHKLTVAADRLLDDLGS